MAKFKTKSANLAVSRMIPAIIVGLLIYACFVVTKPLCIDYLIHPSSRYKRKPQAGLGIVIIVLFYSLLLPVLTTYLRLYHTVILNPDFLPHGELSRRQNDSKGSARYPRSHHGKRVKRQHDIGNEKIERSIPDIEGGRSNRGGANAFPTDASGLEKFYLKDVFVCQPDGRPPYCSECCQFKTDRAHHCREAGRCVRKMDHFCPWVGGVVSETSFKFFLQFIFYATIFSSFNVIVFSVFTAELQQQSRSVNTQWLVTLVLSSFFFLFSAGMFVTSFRLAMINLTTIESLTRRTKVWTLAIYIYDSGYTELNTEAQQSRFPMISYPSVLDPDSVEPLNRDSQMGQQRVFAILQTQPGENPFDLGSSLRNLQQVMGYTVLDWLLPIKPGPCVDHSSTGSVYSLGPVIQRLKREAGLAL